MKSLPPHSPNPPNLKSLPLQDKSQSDTSGCKFFHKITDKCVIRTKEGGERESNHPEHGEQVLVTPASALDPPALVC